MTPQEMSMPDVLYEEVIEVDERVVLDDLLVEHVRHGHLLWCHV